jgi:uroporphyrinogen decarboxylase
LKASNRIPKNIIITGNLHPIKVMMESKPNDVKKETKKLLKKMKNIPNYVLSTGCDIAPDTPLKNIEKVIEAVRFYG